ncbi:MAG: ABC-2 family transporter protein [Candidatus Cohnella colombiensis]|uniref:ABC-2 family transporter protein n=1 Tax=Candidatus Cohnella colombiensis TaxID=3121368 RepID=A0AA95JG08_9BACL|nr:MAG: ABC-2 family transporter protein [Cohnella sp.]
MDMITGLFRLFGWHMKLSVSRAMIYRFDFLTGLFISILVSGIAPLVQYLIFTQTRGYPGWTLGQILLFQGLLLLWFGIRDLLFGDLRGMVMNMVRKGEFDRLLLKPYPPIGVLLCSGFQLNGIGSCIAGIGVSIVAFRQLHLSIDFVTIALFLIAIVAGVILFMAVTVFYCAIVVLIVQMGRMSEMFDRITDFGNYPSNIYPAILQTAMVTFLPFAIWTYYPAQILLHRVDSRLVIAAVSCVLIFWLSIKVWNRSLRNYTSAGG